MKRARSERQKSRMHKVSKFLVASVSGVYDWVNQSRTYTDILLNKKVLEVSKVMAVIKWVNRQSPPVNLLVLVVAAVKEGDEGMG